MNSRRNITTHLLALFMSLQIINISMNISDNVVGKSTFGFIYVNEIETVVEFVLEVCLQKKDAIPENQIPGGTLGFEEEEKLQFATSGHNLNNPIYYIAGLLYRKGIFNESNNLQEPISEVTTPPPEA